ncbi:TadE family protein [Devosia sp. Naph2]|uniref:TadE family protein n=1 Tax=Devosia polycyclovorans TaxID=3345148 RepID=UPI0035D0CE3F
MRRPHGPLWTDHCGTAAIEFAVLTPVFLLLLTGMLAYGIYFGAAHSLQQMAADAARIAIAGLTEAERNSLVEAYIARNAQAYALIDPARLSHTIGDSVVDPSQYVVRLSYDATDLPIWNLYPPLPLPGKTIAYGATIRRGGL